MGQRGKTWGKSDKMGNWTIPVVFLWAGEGCCSGRFKEISCKTHGEIGEIKKGEHKARGSKKGIASIKRKHSTRRSKKGIVSDYDVICDLRVLRKTGYIYGIHVNFARATYFARKTILRAETIYLRERPPSKVRALRTFC